MNGVQICFEKWGVNDENLGVQQEACGLISWQTTRISSGLATRFTTQHVDISKHLSLEKEMSDKCHWQCGWCHRGTLDLSHEIYESTSNVWEEDIEDIEMAYATSAGNFTLTLPLRWWEESSMLSRRFGHGRPSWEFHRGKTKNTNRGSPGGNFSGMLDVSIDFDKE